MRYSSNLSEVLNDLAKGLNAVLPGGVSYERINRIAALSMQPEVSKRIHERGLAASGDIIGEYSRKPAYVSQAANPGQAFGTPVGKYGESIFKTGKKKGEKHTSQYFPDGYLGFKNAIGRNELGTVNLSLSGQLQKQFTILTTEKGWGLGWPNAEMYERALYLEKKYGKPIWAFTTEEKEALNAVYKEEIINAILRTDNR